MRLENNFDMDEQVCFSSVAQPKARNFLTMSVLIDFLMV